MKKFPESSLLFRRQFMIADLSPDQTFDDIVNKQTNEQGARIYQFISPLGYKMNITNNSLDITSHYHKTYNNTQSNNRFRDIIVFVLEPFIELTKIPLINRIGLRYIDECPLNEKNNSHLTSNYNTVFPIDRFNLNDMIDSTYSTLVKRGENYMRYKETFQEKDMKLNYTLDFDAFRTNINSENYLSVTDNLHELILAEYEKSITESVIEYMRGSKTL
jgi:uncharacterized protein (TIGR04255 family)